MFTWGVAFMDELMVPNQWRILKGHLDPLFYTVVIMYGWRWKWAIWIGVDDMGGMRYVNGELGIYEWNGVYGLGLNTVYQLWYDPLVDTGVK